AIQQSRIGGRIDCTETAAGGAQYLAFRHHGMPARIGVDDAAQCIDQKHSGAERVETIGERRRLHLLEIDDLADQHGTADMRDDQCHEPFCVLIDNSIAPAPDHLKERAARGRLLENAEHVVHHLLGSHPLDRESRSAQLAPGNDLDELMDLLYIEEDRARKHGIELCVCVDIPLSETGIIAPGEISVRCLANGVLPQNMGRPAMYKSANSLHNPSPS